MNEIWSQYKWTPFSLDVLHHNDIHNSKHYIVSYHEVFNISKKVTKVDMKQVARCGNHDIVIMSVPNALQMIRM